MADLHGFLPVIAAECDLVCICGDLFPASLDEDDEKQEAWFENSFLPWANALACSHVVFIAGNHDLFLENHGSELKRRFSSAGKIVYLQDSGAELCGLKVWGSPWCASETTRHQHFAIPERLLGYKFRLIPSDTELLLAHAAPSGPCRAGFVEDEGIDLGSPALARAVAKRDKIKVLLCGHIHMGSHIPSIWRGVTVANAALTDNAKNCIYAPLSLSI